MVLKFCCIFAFGKQKYKQMIDFANSGMTRPVGIYGAIKGLGLQQSLFVSADRCKRSTLQQYCWRFNQAFGASFSVHFDKAGDRYIITRTA